MIETKRKSDLREEELKLINEARKRELGSKSEWRSDEVSETEDLIFLLREAATIVAFGRLRKYSLNYDSTSLDFYAISSIVSLEKGKGYGKKLMLEIKKFLNDKGCMGMGFCSLKNSEFYRKSGYEVVKDITDIFQFKEESGNYVKSHFAENILFIVNAPEDLLTLLHDTSLEVLKIDYPIW